MFRWRRKAATPYDDGNEDDYVLHFPPRRAYADYGPFRIVTLVMIALLFLVAAVGALCLLSYVAELAEEYPTYARTVLRVLLVCNLVVHTLIMLIDQLSWWCSCVSLAANVAYWCLMRTFPFVARPYSAPVVTAVVLAVLESVSWYWLSLSLLAYTSTWFVFAFFVLLWLVPIGLFASCILPEECLPGAGVPATMTATTTNMGRSSGSGQRAYLPGGHEVHARPSRTLFGSIARFVRDLAA